jgi:hypothetical protein
MAWAQIVKKKLKQEWREPYVFMTRGMKVVSWCALCIWACLFLNDNCCYMCCCELCTLYCIQASWINYDNIRQGQKPSLVIKILIHCWVWCGKRWKTFVYMCVPLSKTIVVIVSQKELWDAMHSFLH